MLCYFAALCVHQLPQELVPGGKHAPWHRLSDPLLGSLLVSYRERPFLTLEKWVHFVRDNLVGRVQVVW